MAMTMTEIRGIKLVRQRMKSRRIDLCGLVELTIPIVPMFICWTVVLMVEFMPL